MSGRAPGKADCRSAAAMARKLRYAATCMDHQPRPFGAPKSWLHTSIPSACLFIPVSQTTCLLTTIWADPQRWPISEWLFRSRHRPGASTRARRIGYRSPSIGSGDGPSLFTTARRRPGPPRSATPTRPARRRRGSARGGRCGQAADRAARACPRWSMSHQRCPGGRDASPAASGLRLCSRGLAGAVMMMPGNRRYSRPVRKREER